MEGSEKERGRGEEDRSTGEERAKRERKGDGGGLPRACTTANNMVPTSKKAINTFAGPPTSNEPPT